MHPPVTLLEPTEPGFESGPVNITRSAFHKFSDAVKTAGLVPGFELLAFPIPCLVTWGECFNL